MMVRGKSTQKGEEYKLNNYVDQFFPFHYIQKLELS